MDYSVSPYDPQVCINTAYQPMIERDRLHHVAVKAFYVNGIFCTPTDAQKTADQIQRIVQQSGRELHIEPHYNGTFTTFGKLLQLGLVQQEKTLLATELVRKIRTSLAAGYGQVVLFAHSQGADIVEQALRLLYANERDQVEVVAFGGKTAIPGATNFLNVGDYIAKTAQAFTGKPGPLHPIRCEKRCTTLASHGMVDYLNQPTVQNRLKNVANQPLQICWATT